MRSMRRRPGCCVSLPPTSWGGSCVWPHATLHASCAAAPVVGVRVATEDATGLGDVPVVIDPSLRSGDAIVELSGGAIDARLGVRLAQVLEAFG